MNTTEPRPDKTAHALDPAVNAVVLAAAGTGKTWLLTSRILRLLLAGAEPGTILALTFTNKAASEIRERVLARARSLALASPEDLSAELTAIGAGESSRDSARVLYERLLGDRRSIEISTFHGFCQTLLRRFPIESGIAPDFDVIERADDYVDAAWQQLLEEARRAPSAALAVALENLSRRTGSGRAARDALQAFWNHRSEWWAYTEGQTDPVAFAQDRLSVALGPASASPLPELARDLANCASAFSVIPDLSNDAAQITAALSDLQWRDRLCPLFLNAQGKPRRFPVTRSERSRLSDAASAEESWSRAALALIKEDAVRRRQWTFGLSSAWYLCGHTLVQYAQKLKAADRVLDFADLEWQAYSLLRRSAHAEWVQYKLDQKIDHILIDEFQDTSPVQWQLLLPFIEELAAGDSGRGRSVFVVGDEKQSLYGFRGGDVRLLAHVSEWLVARMGAARLTEDTSRRASIAITEFVNLVFSPLPDDAPLPSFRTHASARGTLWGRVEVLPLVHEPNIPDQSAPGGWRNPLSTPHSEATDKRYAIEASTVAQRVREYAQSLVIGDGENARRASYRDMIVLLRDRTHASMFEDALRGAGIPFSGVDRGSLGDALEIRDILDLLTVLLDPEDDCALAALLRTPFFGQADNDLMDLAGRAQADGISWRDALARMEHHPGLSVAGERIARWSAMVDRMPAHDLLDAIFAETDIVRAYEAMAPDVLRARIAPVFRTVLFLALDMDGGRYPGLARFREHLKKMVTQIPTPRSAGADEVRLLTIHGAKGLEAPIVFLVDSARPRKADAGIRPLVDWPPLAPKPAAFHLIGNKDVIDDHSQNALARQSLLQDQEDMNALYVAITRAAQVLVISGCAPKRTTDLGWYGLLEQRLRGERARAAGIRWDDGATEANPCVILERGTMPRSAGTPVPQPGALSVPWPPAAPGKVMTRPVATLVRPSMDTSGPDATRSRAARARGEAVHRLLQLRTSGFSPTVAQHRLAQEFPSLPRSVLSMCQQEVDAVLADTRLRIWFNPDSYLWARNEVRLLYLQDDQVVHGTADRVVMYTDHVDILDYKSHIRIDRSEAPIEATRYRGQMRLYEEAARRLWPEVPCRSFVLFTALPIAVALAHSVDGPNR